MGATQVARSGTRVGRVGRLLLAAVLGAVPAVIIVGAALDASGVDAPMLLSGPVIVVGWAVTTGTFGRAVVGSALRRGALRDVLLRMAAVLTVALGAAGALIRHLLPSATTVERLAWILGEEDNAQIVGIAREVLTEGPRGAGLADQFGTAFVNLPLLLGRLVGGVPGGPDVRLQAIGVFTVSTLVIILLAGWAIAVLAGLPHHVHGGVRARRTGLPSSVLGATAAAAATFVSLSLLVVLPMRTGFLTFVWGLTLVLVGAALVAILPVDASPGARLMVVLSLIGLLVLLLSSWPFIAPALAVLLIVPLFWVDWPRIGRSIRGRPRGSAAVLIVSIAGVAVSGLWFSRWGPAAEVLSYGVDILLAQASGITADAPARWAAVLTLTAAVALVLAPLRRARRSSASLAVAIAGPVVGAGVLYVGLEAAAAVLTDGELNYAGIKLLYGIVTLALTLGLVTLTSQASRFGTFGSLVAAIAVAAVLGSSATARLGTDWWARTDLGEPQHAQAAIDAIGSTSPDIPIRCLPSPGTVVTDVSRLAAYMCARWMEDAFNPGRFQGGRDELLNADGETFGPTVEAIIEGSPSEYLFAYRMTMGPGWFGWNGAS